MANWRLPIGHAPPRQKLVACQTIASSLLLPPANPPFWGLAARDEALLLRVPASEVADALVGWFLSCKGKLLVRFLLLRFPCSRRHHHAPWGSIHRGAWFALLLFLSLVPFHGATSAPLLWWHCREQRWLVGRCRPCSGKVQGKIKLKGKKGKK